MQFERKTRVGNSSAIIKFLVKLILLIVFILTAIILIDRVNFPSPNKKIEKVVPNDNFKIVK